MRYYSRLLLIQAILLTLSGCDTRPPESELPGTYLADHSIASQRLIIRQDGTYTQEITFKATSKVDTASGAWTYDSQDGRMRFDEKHMNLLDGFGKLNPDYATPKIKEGYSSFPVTKEMGTMIIHASQRFKFRKE